jgi:hypothetical protein
MCDISAASPRALVKPLHGLVQYAVYTRTCAGMGCDSHIMLFYYSAAAYVMHAVWPMMHH